MGDTNLVDGDDRFTVLHSCQVLNSTTNADSYIKLRGDNFARLPNLLRIIRITTIYRRS
jgi:hypothetical protein